MVRPTVPRRLSKLSLRTGTAPCDSMGVRVVVAVRRDRHDPSAAPRRQARQYRPLRSEEHTSELQSLMRISYAVFCLKKKNTNKSMTTKTKCIHTHYPIHTYRKI